MQAQKLREFTQAFLANNQNLGWPYFIYKISGEGTWIKNKFLGRVR